MSKEQKTFTDEQKNSIALNAVSGGDEAVAKLAEEHGVSEDTIRNWIRETGVTAVKEEDEEVSLEASDDFVRAVEFGATLDILNYRRLIFWSIFGIAVILIFIQSIKFIYEYTESTAIRMRSEQSQFYDIQQLRQEEQVKLETFGVVDPEAGIYRIPIDSAITVIANQANE